MATLLTNAHVVAGAARIRVVTQGRRRIPRHRGGDRRGQRPRSAENRRGRRGVVRSGEAAAPRQGQLVLAFGSPLGLAQSASLGLVSALDRQLSPEDPRAYIQTDASMNPGNSGGPLVDLEGRLLGVNTMILSQSGGSEGLGFAIPLAVARRSIACAARRTAACRAPNSGLQPRSLTPELIAGLGPQSAQGRAGGRCGAGRSGGRWRACGRATSWWAWARPRFARCAICTMPSTICPPESPRAWW